MVEKQGLTRREGKPIVLDSCLELMRRERNMLIFRVSLELFSSFLFQKEICESLSGTNILKITRQNSILLPRTLSLPSNSEARSLKSQYLAGLLAQRI